MVEPTKPWNNPPVPTNRHPLEEAVLEFQRHIGAPPPAPLMLAAAAKPGDSLSISEAISRTGIELRNLSSYFKGLHVDTRDPRALRTELMLEELGESLEALGDRDELALLDGLADLVYVVVGTATTFALPVEQAFHEVHRSNMTKTSGLDHAAGKTGKGENFRPPNLRRVLNLARGKVICDKCGAAHGEMVQVSGGGTRVVAVEQVGAQKLCGSCRSEK